MDKKSTGFSLDERLVRAHIDDEIWNRESRGILDRNARRRFDAGFNGSTLHGFQEAIVPPG
jgi:hypothetical protein